MQLRILGCQGPYPGAGGATSGYLISHEDTHLLVECGSGVLGRLREHVQVEALSGVLLSHLHGDHCSDLLPMRYLLMERYVSGAMENPMPLYAPEEPENLFGVLSEGGIFDTHLWMQGASVLLGGIEVQCFPVRHPVPCFAMRFSVGGKALVYTGDTNTAPGLADFARGADLLLADGLFVQDNWQAQAPHLSATLCAELARDAGAGQLVLTHLHPDRDPQTNLQEAQTVFAQTALAEMGALWTL